MLVKPWLERLRFRHRQRRRRNPAEQCSGVVERLEDRTLLSGDDPVSLVGGFIADTNIRSGNANNNYGSTNEVRMDGNPDESALVRFDVSAIPAGSTVLSVSLTLTVTNESDDAYEIYQVLRPWVESQVTYNQAANGAAWQTAGVLGSTDRGSAVLGVVAASTTGTTVVQLNAFGVAVVQSWVDDPSTNYGFIFQNYTQNTDKLSFRSSEYSSASQRPSFEVVYETSGAGANAPPEVEAGNDLTVSITNPATLDATITDDGLPAPPGNVNSVWSVVSGPGSVTFADSSSADTTAEFSTTGTYVLRLTADDGEFSAFDEVTVTVVDQAVPEKEESGSFPKTGVSEIAARVETDPMPDGGDAADDAAIWVHPTDSSLSLIIGTDKSTDGGLRIYDLAGNELAFIEAGEHNNVDLRYGFSLNGELVDLVSASNRDTDAIDVYRVDPVQRTLIPIGSIDSGISVYGYGMYHSRQTGKFYGFVNSKDGEVEQWEIIDAGNGQVTGVLVREFDVGGQTEGFVADDELGFVYIGEEAEGIWKYGAEPNDSTPGVQVDHTGSGGHLTADVEGLTIYYRRDGKGYLIASSQGSDEFTVYRREGNNEYLGTFSIEDGTVDGASNTDGIAVTNMSLGSGDFFAGLLVVHDGNNDGNQNFKLVAWEDIAADSALGLAIDTTGWNVRGGPVDPGANQPPSVDAGPNQSISLGASATLSGSVADDGLPNPPSSVTVSWSVVSGPGTVTFVDESAQATLATFSAAGSYTLRLSASDGELTASDDLTVNVTAAGNASPQANDDSYTLLEGGTLSADDAAGTVGGSNDDGVLVNDTDADGDPLNAVLVSLPAHGALTFNSNGTFVYTHNGSNNFSDSFTYRDHDGTTFGNVATVHLAITPVNEAPVALSESYTVGQGGSLFADDADGTSGSAADNGVLANDLDADGDPLNAVLVAGPAHGALTLNSDGTFVYTHDGSSNFADSFTYRANDGAADSGNVTVAISVTPAEDNPHLRTGVVTGVTSTSWTTVTLDRNYASMVVIASVNYDETSVPLVTRIRNASGNSFELKVDRTDDETDPADPITVYYIVAEEGVYTQAEHGVTMEAVKYTSTVTDRFGSWVGQSRTYANSYTAPVVIGQVMSYNDSDFSVFWARGSSQAAAPSSGAFFAGKHVGEHSDTTRANETVGYIVIETGTGTISGRSYAAAVGAASIDDVIDGSGDVYSISGLSSAVTAVVSQAGMTGNDGGWAVLFGDTPLTSTSLTLGIDEDQASDNERAHLAERVAYLVLSNSPPSVYAGPDQTILIGGQAVLDATVTDDGFPNPPGNVTTTWSTVSGPGRVTFANASAVDTIATFSAAGSYTLRLTVSDGLSTTIDQMTVLVTSQSSNVAPQVNAGVDQTVVLTDAANLDGTVSDDGLPSPPGIVTTEWSFVSGPGTVTFANEFQIDTTASFSTPGTYVLQLGASDGALFSADSVTVTVTAPVVNQAPQVNAGSGQSILLGELASLDGTVSDDGLPNPPGGLTVQWSRLSGPGSVSFANEFQVDTSADFSAAGTYVLRLSASDGELTTVDTLTVVVEDPAANQPPDVEAGPDRSIILSEAASLNGTVTDDGLPGPPGNLATEWTVLTGPGTATFADRFSVDTTVTFSAAGSYVLQLSADDGELASSDIVTVTVNESAELITISFQDGQSPTGSYSGTRDAEIRSRAPSKNYGDSDTTKLDGDPDESGLFFWDVTAIPAGSVVVSASITLNVINPSDDGFELYEALRPWIESEVTFDEYADGAAWDVPGAAGPGDRGSTVLGTLLALTQGFATIELNAAGVALVQSWVDNPATNLGVALQDYEQATDRLEYETREASVAANRPRLTIVYDISPVAGNNLPPQVDAGPDQAVFLNEAATLVGTLVDDGLPIPTSQVTTIWSMATGPGSVTFADATSIQTTATFSETGTYTLRLTANDTEFTVYDEIIVSVNSAQPLVGIWLSVDEVMSLPTSGAAWNNLVAAAATPLGTPNISNQDDMTDVLTLAKALVGVRTGNQQYLDEVRTAILAAMNTEDGGRTLALSRNLVSYIIAADLVGLQPADDAAFRAWLAETLTENLEGRTLQSTHEDRPNNWGTNAGASRAALALYLQDQQELQRTADVFKGWLGDRSSYTGFTFDSDLSWHADAQAPVGINPLGSTKDGYLIDGVLPDDMQRGGPFALPADETVYPWEGLQGAVVQAEILYRAGYNVYEWENRAILRAVEFLYGIGWSPEGTDDAWIPYIIDARYGTNFANAPQANPGKNMGWTQWTHGSGGTPASNQAPVAYAGPDHEVFVWESAELFGMFTDDGWPISFDDVQISWSMTSGPGAATFSNAGERETSVTFSAPGTYVLRFTVDDTELSDFDEIVVTVNGQPPNQPPQVNAGADLSIFLTETANLNGTVTDDGWPYPFTQLVTTWSVVSGPGTVTFGNANAVDTTASFSAAGTYVLRLSADDSQLTASDEVTVVVETIPVNQPPAVDAGADLSILLVENAVLDGTVTDDGWPQPPGATTTFWSVVSGPGSVVFANQQAIDTTASFSTAGTYVLRLTADDGEFTGADDVTITVSEVAAEITLEFQDGVSNGGAYAGTTDSMIETGSANTNFGTETDLEIDGSPDRAALFRWDVSSIAPGTTVASASITLNVINTTDDVYELYQLLRPWVENQVTWNRALQGSNWEVSGARGSSDSGSTVLGTFTSGSRTLVTIELNAAGLAVVQSWINDPQSNYGVIIQDYTDASNGVDVNSREVGNAANRPKLTVTVLANSASSLSLASGTVSTSSAALSSDDSLTHDQIQPLVEAAAASWESVLGRVAGDALSPVTVIIADLPGQLLGQTLGTTILIDADAAGYGWFVDATPMDHSEFSPASGQTGPVVASDSPAAGRVDLYSVLLHEMGHVLGFKHDDGDSVMDDTLPLGMRRLPGDETSADAQLETLEPAAIDAYFQQFP